MKFVKLFVLVLLMVSCSKYAGIPKQYHALLDRAVERADTNKNEILRALKETPKHAKEGMAFLVSYMPERDLTSLKSDYLIRNVQQAYAARERFSWAKEVPDSLFFNDVLPYVTLNETRDEWREDFLTRFTPYVVNATTIKDAILSLNKNIRDELLVDYNTKREKPDQSPSESLRQKMASCSGLSILLCDAFRSVGIPSRIAGTVNWSDNRGNHNWCEVWIDGQWYFTEYYPDELNRSWFLADAGKADAADRRHAIYASSFKPTGDTFPLVWDMSIDYVPGINVTHRYLHIYKKYHDSLMAKGDRVTLSVSMYKGGKESKLSGDRIAVNVDIFCDTEQTGGGRTAGPMQDMNDVLEFVVEKGKTYTLRYTDQSGKAAERRVIIGDKNLKVIL